MSSRPISLLLSTNRPVPRAGHKCIYNRWVAGRERGEERRLLSRLPGPGRGPGDHDDDAVHVSQLQCDIVNQEPARAQALNQTAPGCLGVGGVSAGCQPVRMRFRIHTCTCMPRPIRTHAIAILMKS